MSLLFQFPGAKYVVKPSFALGASGAFRDLFDDDGVPSELALVALWVKVTVQIQALASNFRFLHEGPSTTGQMGSSININGAAVGTILSLYDASTTDDSRSTGTCRPMSPHGGWRGPGIRKIQYDVTVTVTGSMEAYACYIPLQPGAKLVAL